MVSSNGYRAESERVSAQRRGAGRATAVGPSAETGPPTTAGPPAPADGLAAADGSAAEGATAPPRSAPFAAKLDYYRSQHTTKGIRLTHLVGIPGVAFSLPVLAVAPRKALRVFVASWALQVFGHRVFEKNSPALTKGFLTYQLCGLAFWCEEVVDLVSGRGLGDR